MNRKITLSIVTAGLVIAGTVFNLSINMQKPNVRVSLSGIEALTVELSAVEKEILLQGSLSTVPVKSFAPQPFRVIKHSSYITVNCLISLNFTVTVQIVKASGQTVYSSTVNPVAGGQLNISLASLPAGDYTIVFTAPNGSSMYGDFEI